MEKRRLVGLLIGLIVLIAGIVTALVLWWGNREVLLVEQYPAVARGQYQAAIMWGLGEPSPAIESAVSNEEFQQILSAVRVKKREKTKMAPEVEFFIHFYDEESQTSYSIELGKDHSITVARSSDLEQSRTYWTDCEGDVFAKLYACHLQHGGAAIDP